MNKQLKFSISLLIALSTGLLVLLVFDKLGQTIFAPLKADESLIYIKNTVELCMEQYLFHILTFVAAAMAGSFLGNLLFKEPNRFLFSCMGVVLAIVFVAYLTQLSPPAWVVISGLFSIPIFSFFGYRFALRLHY